MDNKDLINHLIDIKADTAATKQLVMDVQSTMLEHRAEAQATQSSLSTLEKDFIEYKSDCNKDRTELQEKVASASRKIGSVKKISVASGLGLMLILLQDTAAAKELIKIIAKLIF